MSTTDKYLKEKKFNAKPIAVALFMACSLALTACGQSQEQPAQTTQQEQQIDGNYYRLQIDENRFYDFNVKKVNESSYRGSMYKTYKTEEGIVIEFTNTGCHLYLTNDDYVNEKSAATYMNASIEKIDMPFEWNEIDDNEITTETLGYDATDTEKTIEYNFEQEY